MAEESPWKLHAERVLALVHAGRKDAALAYLDEVEAGLPDETRAARPFAVLHEVAGALYWHCRALDAYVVLSHERIRRVEVALDGDPAPDAWKQLVWALGGTHYNLAAFAWPGWGEADVRIGPEEYAAGRESAARCLAVRLDPVYAEARFGYTPGMAHWVVGAYCLSDGDYAGARREFARAVEWERGTGEDDALSAGYLSLTDVLEHPEDAAAASSFEAALASLEGRTDEDAAFHRDQLKTARRVLQGATAAEGG